MPPLTQYFCLLDGSILKKGGLMFAQAALEVNVPAVFVGDGAEADAIRKANPDARILGWQSPAEVAKWMRQARALVFPSLWYEGQPLVPLEALAQGIPVVCGDWSAAAEKVVNDLTGIVYKEPTVQSLSGAILRCQKLNFDPKGDTLHDLSPDVHLARLVRIYNKLLNDGVDLV